MIKSPIKAAQAGGFCSGCIKNKRSDNICKCSKYYCLYCASKKCSVCHSKPKPMTVIKQEQKVIKKSPIACCYICKDMSGLQTQFEDKKCGIHYCSKCINNYYEYQQKNPYFKELVLNCKCRISREQSIKVISKFCMYCNNKLEISWFPLKDGRKIDKSCIMQIIDKSKSLNEKNKKKSLEILQKIIRCIHCDNFIDSVKHKQGNNVDGIIICIYCFEQTQKQQNQANYHKKFLIQKLKNEKNEIQQQKLKYIKNQQQRIKQKVLQKEIIKQKQQQKRTSLKVSNLMEQRQRSENVDFCGFCSKRIYMSKQVGIKKQKQLYCQDCTKLVEKSKSQLKNHSVLQKQQKKGFPLNTKSQIISINQKIKSTKQNNDKLEEIELKSDSQNSQIESNREILDIELENLQICTDCNMQFTDIFGIYNFPQQKNSFSFEKMKQNNLKISEGIPFCKNCIIHQYNQNKRFKKNQKRSEQVDLTKTNVVNQRMKMRDTKIDKVKSQQKNMKQLIEKNNNLKHRQLVGMKEQMIKSEQFPQKLKLCRKCYSGKMKMNVLPLSKGKVWQCENCYFREIV